MESGSIQCNCQTNLLPWCLVNPCVPGKGFMELACGSSEFEEIHSLVLFQSVLNSTISCTSQLGEVCPLLWCLGLHGQLCCTDFIPPIPSHHALWFRTVVPYTKNILENIPTGRSFIQYEVSHQMVSMPHSITSFVSQRQSAQF